MATKGKIGWSGIAFVVTLATSLAPALKGTCAGIGGALFAALLDTAHAFRFWPVVRDHGLTAEASVWLRHLAGDRA